MNTITESTTWNTLNLGWSVLLYVDVLKFCALESQTASDWRSPSVYQLAREVDNVVCEAQRASGHHCRALS
jgi:hypothetical protein